MLVSHELPDTSPWLTQQASIQTSEAPFGFWEEQSNAQKADTYGDSAEE